MIYVARFGLSAVVVGLAVVVGCFVPPRYDGPTTGQGGATTTATSSTGAVPCSMPDMPCADDGNPCTQEACTKGFCTSTPLTLAIGPGSTECSTIACKDGTPKAPVIHTGQSCGMGLTCTLEGKCGGCTSDGQCGKTDECQKSTCQSNMICMYEFAPYATKVTTTPLSEDKPGDCQATICNESGMLVLAVDDMDTPTAQEDCQEWHCANGNAEKSPAPVGTACEAGTKICSLTQSCVVCTVSTGCPSGLTCYNEAECVSCIDGKQNGDESDVDCGGSMCGACVDGKACGADNDCASAKCESGVCIGCNDKIKNNGEAGVDCGGPCSLKYDDGTPCGKGADCSSGECTDGVCCATECTGECTACNVPGKLGQCVQLGKGHDDTMPVCSGAMTCSSGSCVSDGGKKHFGEVCGFWSECFSNNCSSLTHTCN
jgi:hypothetical protein